jgi:hypothetical protein
LPQPLHRLRSSEKPPLWINRCLSLGSGCDADEFGTVHEFERFLRHLES